MSDVYGPAGASILDSTELFKANTLLSEISELCAQAERLGPKNGARPLRILIGPGLPHMVFRDPAAIAFRELLWSRFIQARFHTPCRGGTMDLLMKLSRGTTSVEITLARSIETMDQLQIDVTIAKIKTGIVHARSNLYSPNPASCVATGTEGSTP